MYEHEIEIEQANGNKGTYTFESEYEYDSWQYQEEIIDQMQDIAFNFLDANQTECRNCEHQECAKCTADCRVIKIDGMEYRYEQIHN